MKKYTTPEIELLSFATEDIMEVSEGQVTENRTEGDNLFDIFGV